MANVLQLRENNPYFNGVILEFPIGSPLLIRPKLRYTASPNDRLHIVRDGEDLLSIAFKYYGDSKEWHVIADVNDDIINPLELQTGYTLIIPDLVRIKAIAR